MKQILQQAHAYFDAYVATFYNTDDQEVIYGIKLKEEHTSYVTENCRQLATSLGLNKHDVDLCELIGLLHDIGRFRQWSVYKTFRDNLSEDHAELGVKVIKELDIFQQLNKEDQDLLLFAISNHNKKEIQTPPSDKQLLLAKIIRDADKLDIYRINADKICHPCKEDYSDICLSNFVKGEQINFPTMQTPNDLKLVYLLWCYDVYYNWTLQQIWDKGYVQRICTILKKNPQVEAGIQRLYAYIEARLKTSQFTKSTSLCK